MGVLDKQAICGYRRSINRGDDLNIINVLPLSVYNHSFAQREYKMRFRAIPVKEQSNVGLRNAKQDFFPQQDISLVVNEQV